MRQTAMLTTIKFLRDKNESSIKEAFNLFHKLMVDPAIDMEAYELYVATVDTNFKMVVEYIFQASDLKWDACHKIAGKLQAEGIISV